MLRLLVLFALATAAALLTWWWSATRSVPPTSGPAVRYVAMGDSYTVGQGVRTDEAWPTQLAAALRRRGHRVELVATLAVTGWTTQDLEETALPIALASRPQLVTLMIGANDVVQGTSEATFRERLARIMAALAASASRQVVVLTIPDFTVTPAAASFDPTAAARLAIFNQIIRDEASRQGLPVVNLTDRSRRLSVAAGMLAADGLHPSAAQYTRWLDSILDTVVPMLSARTPVPAAN